MSDLLSTMLRVAGVGLFLLALVHVPVARHFKWREDAERLSRVNASIFRIHAFFICLALVGLGLPCLIEPTVFLEGSRASQWLAWSTSILWVIRLVWQWVMFPSDLWRGQPLRIMAHVWLTIVWAFLALLFAACGAYQAGWLR